MVYDGVVTSHRKTIAKVGPLDPITEDMLIKQTGQLEQFQWFMRAHLEDRAGTLSSAGAQTETAAAKKST